VSTGIDERIQFTVLIARDDDRLTTNPCCVVVVIVWNLAFVSQVDPVRFEEVLHLQFEQFWIGEDIATAAENTLFFVVFKAVSSNVSTSLYLSMGAIVLMVHHLQGAARPASFSGVLFGGVVKVVYQAARRGRSTI
jgi:hypothetical protein